MTPYIVTHCQYVQDARPWTDVKSRRAVATLEEAQREASDAVFVAIVRAEEDRRRDGKPTTRTIVEAMRDCGRPARHVPESGGTVGPLPDGTVLAVEPWTVEDAVEWLFENDAISEEEHRSLSSAELVGRFCAAFNARQLA